MHLVTRIWGVFYAWPLSVWGAPLSELNSPMRDRVFPADRTELDHSKGRPGTSMSTDPVQRVLSAGMRPWGPGTGAIEVTRHSTATRALAVPHKSHRDLGWTPHISLPLALLLPPAPPCSGYPGLLAALQMPQGRSCLRAFAFAPWVPWNTVLSDLLVSDQMSPQLSYPKYPSPFSVSALIIICHCPC